MNDNPYDRTVKRLGQARGAIHWLIALTIFGFLVSCYFLIEDAVGTPVQHAVSDRPIMLLDEAECSGQNPDMDTVVCAASWWVREEGEDDMGDALYFPAALGKYEYFLNPFPIVILLLLLWRVSRANASY